MRFIFSLTLCALCMAAMVSCSTTAVEQQETASEPQIVASVNGQIIKKGEYKQELDTTYRRFHEAGQMIDGSMFEQLKQEVLESLINLILMDDYSKELSLVVEDGTVEKHYQKAVSNYASKSAYRDALKEAGITESDLRTRIKRTLAAQMVVKEHVYPKIIVTDDEVKTYYEENSFEFEHGVQVHAAHILIKVPPFADKDFRQKAKQRILEIKDKIASGEDFAQLAKTHSEGPSKVNGGDLGYFGAAQMAPAFETAAFSLKPGEVSDVVTTQFGFHLIKVYDRKPAGKVPFSEAATMLKQRFYKERLDRELQKLVETLKAEATIERFPLD